MRQVNQCGRSYVQLENFLDLGKSVFHKCSLISTPHKRMEGNVAGVAC